MARTFKDIQQYAEGLLISAGVSDVYPVPLESVAQYLGFETLAFDFGDEISGAIEYDKKAIYINKNQSATRQRFTLAHEIGHAAFHEKEGNVIDYRKNIDSPDPSNRKEVEANHFAANLLMPTEPFIWAWKSRGGDAERVAAYFGVSKQSATIRAQYLGLQ